MLIVIRLRLITIIVIIRIIIVGLAARNPIDCIFAAVVVVGDGLIGIISVVIG